MPRSLRYVPTDGALVEVTTKTIQGRFLLRPSRITNEIIVGVVGRAQRIYGVRICATIWMSTHHHMLVWVTDAKQLAEFMGYVNSNVARKLGRWIDWPGRFWSSRFRAIPVSSEPEAQERRLRYLLAHGVKEGLVSRPQNWPGVQCVESLLSGKELAGRWITWPRRSPGTRSSSLRRQFIKGRQEVIQLSPLPCWDHLTANQVRERIQSLVDSIATNLPGSEKARVRRILKQRPHHRPKVTDLKTGPRFHAVQRQALQGLMDDFSTFLGEFRRAADDLKQHLEVRSPFPIGCFPPGLPFTVKLAANPSAL